MLVAYLDDSGSSPSNRVIAVAGYLSSEKLWQEFNLKWARLLTEYGVAIMRRADLEAFQGEFRGWNGTRRTEFLQKAHSIIKRYTYTAFGSAIVKQDYEDNLPPENFIRVFAGLYDFCCYASMIAIEDWRQRYNHKQPVNVVFEAGTDGYGQMDRMLRECRLQLPLINKWSFGSKEILPLQAADVIAYEYYRIAEKGLIKKQPLGFRRSAKDLFRERDTLFFREWDKRVFQLWMKKWNDALVARQTGIEQTASVHTNKVG